MFQLIERIARVLNKLNSDLTKVTFESNPKGTLVELRRNELYCVFIIPDKEENIEQFFILPVLHALENG